MGTDDAASRTRYFAHDNLRDSQRDMLYDAINMLEQNGFLLAAAPTGIGKTAASLAAALEIIRNSPNGEKILFLTGRQSQHKIVVDTIRIINNRIKSNVPKIKLVDIIGREGMCENVQPITGQCSCEEEVVEGARKNRRMDLKDIILSDPMHVEDTIKIARDKKICPWAAARIAARESDIIVCDYNHVFIEDVMKLSLPAMGVELGRTILIVDEAHNLPDRIRNGLERRVRARDFQYAYDELGEFLETKEKNIKKLDIENISGNMEIENIRNTYRQMDRLRKEIKSWFKKHEIMLSGKDDLRIETHEFLDYINSLLIDLEVTHKEGFTVMGKMIQQLFSVKVDIDETIEEEENTACSRLGYMLETCIEYRDSSALALVFDNELEEGRIRSFLLDPGVVSGPLFEQTYGSILMSGTLYPPSMYSDILQIPEGRKYISKEYKSDFLSNRRPVLIARDVTTKYTDRGIENTRKIREHILSTLNNSLGHVALFFPSYMMLKEIIGDYRSWGLWGFSVIEESRSMTKREVREQIEELHRKKRSRDRCLLIGVLGGKFSEGVDYPDNILEAVICVGLPLPPPSAKQDALKSYYEKRFGNILAWRYASSQPAVNSLMQAIGRPIRKEQDRALVILLEKRLLQRNYKICMPDSLQIRQTSNSQRTAKTTKSFFEHFPEPAKLVD